MPQTPTPGAPSRALLSRLPRESLLVIRLPAIERLREAWPRTALKRMFEEPALMAPVADAFDEIERGFAKMRKDAPMLDKLCDMAGEEHGELVVAITGIAPGSQPGFSGSIQFDARERADQFQRSFDSLLAAGGPKPFPNFQKKRQGWGFEFGTDPMFVDVQRDGTRFVASFGPRLSVQGHPLEAIPAAQSFLATEVARVTPNADRGVLEIYVNLAPLMAIAKIAAPPEAMDFLRRSGFLNLEGGSISIALAEQGLNEVLTLCSPGAKDMISRAWTSRPMNKAIARWVPANAESCGLYTFDLARFFGDVQTMLPAAARGEMDAKFDELKRVNQIDIRDAIANVGPTCAVVTSGDLSSWMERGGISMCAAIEVADSAKAERTIAASLVALGVANKVRSSIVEGATVREIDVPANPGHMQTVMWSRAGDTMLVATDRELLGAALSAGREGTECEQAALRAALDRADAKTWCISMRGARDGLPPTVAEGRCNENGLVLTALNGSGALTTEGVFGSAAIIASAALPKLLAARSEANERAAIWRLRSLSSAEAVVQSAGVCDIDSDGMGEYMFLDELCSASPVRGSSEKLEPRVFNNDWVELRGGTATKNGYVYRIDLPARNGARVSRASSPNEIADEAEIEFTIYAWPLEAGQTGLHVFVLDQEGDMWCTDNSAASQGWYGFENGPKPGSWNSGWGITHQATNAFNDPKGGAWLRVEMQ
jgi:hypothetical protein